MGRQIAPTMSADGAGWLIRMSRETEEQPRILLKALQLKPWQHVLFFARRDSSLKKAELTPWKLADSDQNDHFDLPETPSETVLPDKEN